MPGAVSPIQPSSPVFAGTGGIKATVAMFEALRSPSACSPGALRNRALPDMRAPHPPAAASPRQRPESLGVSSLSVLSTADKAVLDVLRPQTRRSTSPTSPTIEGKGTIHTPPRPWGTPPDTAAHSPTSSPAARTQAVTPRRDTSSHDGRLSPVTGNGAGATVLETGFKREITSLSPPGSPPLVSSIPSTPPDVPLRACKAVVTPQAPQTPAQWTASPTAAEARQFWQQRDSESLASSRANSPAPASGPVITEMIARDRVQQEIRQCQQRDQQWEKQHLSNERWRYDALFLSAFVRPRS